MFYIYEWYDVDSDIIFYVGKGTKNRYRQHSKRNKLFTDYYHNHNCNSRIIKEFEKEEDAFKYEYKRILELNASSILNVLKSTLYSYLQGKKYNPNYICSYDNQQPS